MTSRRLRVDGHDWLVTERTGIKGQYDFRWLSGPNTGYGFSSGGGTLDEAAMTSAISDFLAGINPETGHLD